MMLPDSFSDFQGIHQGRSLESALSTDQNLVAVDGDLSFPRFCGQSFRPPSRTSYGLYESVLRIQWG